MMKFLNALLVTLIIFAPITAAYSCGGSSPEKAAETGEGDLTWIKSDLLIYGFDSGGLYEAHLNSAKKKILARFGQKYSFAFYLDPNGKYIFYSVSDSRAVSAEHNFYLYDIAGGINHKLDLPYNWLHQTLPFAGFSPDGQYLAWLKNATFDAKKSPDVLPSIIVYSTDNLSRKEFNLPIDQDHPNNLKGCFPPTWGPDGNFIYSTADSSELHCFLEEADKHNLIYFKTNITTGETTKVDGSYKFDEKNYEFKNYYIDNDKSVEPLFPCGGLYCVPQSDADKSNAYFVGSNIFVKIADAAPIKVASGTYSPCDGSNIRIIAWVGEGRYLIYVIDDKAYIYGAAENRNASLPQLSGRFGWRPIEFRHSLQTNGSGNVPGSSILRHSINLDE